MIKRSALYIFRNLEHTVLLDVVNQTFQQVVDGGDVYRAKFLLNEKAVALGDNRFQKAREAILDIGDVSAGDLVIDMDGVVGKVVSFWKKQDHPAVFVVLDAYRCVNSDIKIQATDGSTRRFVDSDTIVDVLFWCDISPGIIRVAIPSALVLPKGKLPMR